MGDFGSLMWGILFGSFGMGYFVYGKKRGRMVPLFSGIILCVFPYFVQNPVSLVLIGLILIVLPFIIKV